MARKQEENFCKEAAPRVETNCYFAAHAAEVQTQVERAKQEGWRNFDFDTGDVDGNHEGDGNWCEGQFGDGDEGGVIFETQKVKFEDNLHGLIR